MSGGLFVKVASSLEDRRAVYKQRYSAYVHEGAIFPSSSGIFVDRYDDLTTSILIGVYNAEDEVAGSLRFSVQPPRSSKHGLPPSCPELLIFHDVFDELEIDNRPIASGSRFAIRHEHQNRAKISLLLMIAQTLAAKAVGAKWGIATARGTHLRFYERLLMMTPICAPRRMPGLNYDYSLLASNLDDNFEISMQRFSKNVVSEFDASNPSWEKSIRAELAEINGAKDWLPSS